MCCIVHLSQYCDIIMGINQTYAAMCTHCWLLFLPSTSKSRVQVVIGSRPSFFSSYFLHQQWFSLQRHFRQYFIEALATFELSLILTHTVYLLITGRGWTQSGITQIYCQSEKGTSSVIATKTCNFCMICCLKPTQLYMHKQNLNHFCFVLFFPNSGLIPRVKEFTDAAQANFETFFPSQHGLNESDLYSSLAGWCCKLNSSHEWKRQFQRKNICKQSTGRRGGGGGAKTK